jgi:hypothetical protein
MIDIEVERVRAAFDSPEQYPGEALEGVIYGLMGDIKEAGYSTSKDRRELRGLCERLIARIDQREAMS